ncbi:MAG: deoxyribodipyrimidine photo-lyase/cryptochrome family protein [Bdellovibrionales bacterium]
MTNKSSCAIVWLKKDLRVQDHRPFYEATQTFNRVVALYIYESAWFNSYEFHPSHLQFLNESLTELENKLAQLNIQLVIRSGEAVEVFKDLKKEFDFECVLAHQETGNSWTFKRDLMVIDYFKNFGIQFKEYYQFSVIRRLQDRDLWNNYRVKIIQRKLIPYPKSAPKAESLKSENIRTQFFDKNNYINNKMIQSGGENEAHQTLNSFLYQRGQKYLNHISSPFLSEKSCSRISAYLSFGNLTLTQVHHALKQAQQYHPPKSDWSKSLWAFENRLWWHCHFIQKLESEPEIENKNMNRAFDGLRESDFNNSLFEAWKKGETGFPMVDATMRCLQQTGWINFRMRAMLVSFASYQLWLHWQKPAEFLAQHFLDFEPGIHFSQFQMQSGVTGINAIRIYSPTKQALDQKGSAQFIKKYIPELMNVPDDVIHNPSDLEPLLQIEHNCVLGRDYPLPIVDPKLSYQLAKKRIFEFRTQESVKAQAQDVLKKHASRSHSKARSHFPKQDRHRPMGNFKKEKD